MVAFSRQQWQGGSCSRGRVFNSWQLGSRDTRNGQSESCDPKSMLSVTPSSIGHSFLIAHSANHSAVDQRSNHMNQSSSENHTSEMVGHILDLNSNEVQSKKFPYAVKNR